MQQSGNEGGFAAVSMPQYSDIADLTSLVGFHGRLLGKAPAVRQPPSAGPRQQKGAGFGFGLRARKNHGPRRASFSKDGCYHRESGEVLWREEQTLAAMIILGALDLCIVDLNGVFLRWS
jgi:hypothetical protein